MRIFVPINNLKQTNITKVYEKTIAIYGLSDSASELCC